MNNLQDIFVPYTESLKIKQLGFDEPCLSYFEIQKNALTNKHNAIVKYPTDIAYLESQKKMIYILGQSTLLRPTFDQVFKFFRNKYELDSHIIYDGFSSNNKLLKCYSFDIIKGFSDNELTKRSDNFEKVLDFSKQDIPGNYVNDEKFEEGLFKFYGYKTYEEARLECLKQLIKICKQN